LYGIKYSNAVTYFKGQHFSRRVATARLGPGREMMFQIEHKVASCAFALVTGP
jgi:hypothetical protein